KKIKKLLSLLLVCIMTVSMLLPITATAVTGISSEAENFLLSQLEKQQSKIDMSAYNLPYSWFQDDNFSKFLLENPKLFFVSQSFRYSYGVNYVATFEPKYTFTPAELAQAKSHLDIAAKEILAKIDHNMTQAEKVFVVYTALASMCKYDIDTYKLSSMKNEMPYNAYGALVEGNAVCNGYVLAFNYIMSLLGIETEVVTSDSMGHTWSKVKVDGQWYNVDPTWADPVFEKEDDTDREGYIDYNYFMISDNTINDKKHGHSGGVSTNNAIDRKYESLPFTSVNTMALYNEGRWYYGEDYFYGGNIISSNFDGSDKKTLNLGGTKAYALAQIGEYIYFTASDEDKIDADRIMKVRFDGTGLAPVVDLSKTGETITELSVSFGQLRYVKRAANKYTLVIEDLNKVLKAYWNRFWVSRRGQWYYYTGLDTAKGWFKTGNVWYYSDNNGVMQTNWLKDGNTWYYLGADGAMRRGWYKDGNTWYYSNSSGAMKTGWLKDGSTWYYLKPSGAMATGWALVGSTWYYMNSSGAMQTGWVTTGGSWYYLNSDGAMRTSPLTEKGVTYYFNSDGSMK
ncbi:MAG: hypothetical protein IKV58_01215, partial [Oscillospiraceae bacterium]|nr:hypothetical protein [Oscillospiraceae bacterium]